MLWSTVRSFSLRGGLGELTHCYSSGFGIFFLLRFCWMCVLLFCKWEVCSRVEASIKTAAQRLLYFFQCCWPVCENLMRIHYSLWTFPQCQSLLTLKLGMFTQTGKERLGPDHKSQVWCHLFQTGFFPLPRLLHTDSPTNTHHSWSQHNHHPEGSPSSRCNVFSATPASANLPCRGSIPKRLEAHWREAHNKERPTEAHVDVSSFLFWSLTCHMLMLLVFSICFRIDIVIPDKSYSS